jgi:hypothetical protein
MYAVGPRSKGFDAAAAWVRASEMPGGLDEEL